MIGKQYKKGTTTLTVYLNAGAIDLKKKKLLECLWKAVEAVHTDLVQSQTMPRKTGYLQNEATYVVKPEENGGKAGIHTVAEYATRLYYHPEFKFNKDKNPNAQAYWLKTYITGDDSDLMMDFFKQFCEQG